MNAALDPRPELPTDDGLPAAFSSVVVDKWRVQSRQTLQDVLIEETPVALSYNGVSHAVMLASPTDLEDFALGFSLSEGIIGHAGELHDLEVLPACEGVVIEMRIAQPRFLALKERRRALTGRTGCGLCGVESLSCLPRTQAPGTLPQFELDLAAIDHALRGLPILQPLREATGASHAAAWADLAGDLLYVREDVGRHNALDKLVGALSKARVDPASGFALVSSRASYEMVQKAVSAGFGALIAVSAPTAMAMRNARAAGLLLAGFARPGQLVAYTGAERLKGALPASRAR